MFSKYNKLRNVNPLRVRKENGLFSSEIYNKRDDFDSDTVELQWLEH